MAGDNENGRGQQNPGYSIPDAVAYKRRYQSQDREQTQPNRHAPDLLVTQWLLHTRTESSIPPLYGNRIDRNPLAGLRT